ncbi:MAG: hypothetical protein M3081_02975 [Gemmatimonadota bacterium]|nr:hypothetical protein [Gemmatimonadota bacterium]
MNPSPSLPCSLVVCFRLQFDNALERARPTVTTSASATALECRIEQDPHYLLDANGSVRDPLCLEQQPATGQNSVLAYSRGAGGSLTAISGRPFLTGGSGVANATQKLGPHDVDFPIAVSTDDTRLFAANPGSNTIAVMTIKGTPVWGRPSQPAASIP